MPPVPVHIDDPITPNKPQGTTPQTTELRQQDLPSPANNTTTAPHSQNQSQSYPPAQPGAAAALPAPTPYIPRPQPAPTRTQQALEGEGVPPPPQPGAIPVPSSQYVQQTAIGSSLPPPPRAGERPPQTIPPSQMNLPPPTSNYAPTHSTNAYMPPTAAGATTINLGPAPAELQIRRPAGYQQNAYAQDMTPAQRASLDQQQRKESVLGSLGGEGAGEAAGDVWSTVKGWVGAAGEALAKGEEEVWKVLNRKS